MVDNAWRWLLLGGVAVGLGAGVGCAAKDEPPSQNGSGGTPSTGGVGASGGAGGTSGSSGAGGSGGAVGGSAGTPAGGAGPVGGSGGTPPVAGGSAGVGGSAGTPALGGAGGAGAGGSAGDAGGASGGVAGSAGSSGSAGSAGSAGAGGGPATLTDPIARNGNYVLEFGGIYFEVTPNGARVLDLHLAGGMNLLTTNAVNATNFGSTFWTAPQSVWSWPPPAEVDTAAYTATVTSPAVAFVGTASAMIGASISKKFTADLANVAIKAEYTINATAAGKSFAPWEITRFFKRGLTFWPTGSVPAAGTDANMDLAPTTTGAGCTWHTASATTLAKDQKLFADGTGGWLAHLDGDTVVVKKFADLPMGMAAPAESEIELYVSKDANYIEMEQQGAYQPLAMGMSSTWTVTWIVRKLPQGLTPAAGSQELVTFVQSLVQ